MALRSCAVSCRHKVGNRATLGQLRRVVARGRDYLPDSGRFDVSAPGTPFASPDHSPDLRLLTEATRRRQAQRRGA